MERVWARDVCDCLRSRVTLLFAGLSLGFHLEVVRLVWFEGGLGYPQADCFVNVSSISIALIGVFLIQS